ncbi:MAG: ATP-binding protein [Syntrophorhabdales bacterium]|jgi:two-component system sensor histidine kinase GlrK
MKLTILQRSAIGYLAVFLLLAASNLYSVLELRQIGTATIPSLKADIKMIDYQKRLVDSILSQLRYERKYLLIRDSGLYDQYLEANAEFHRCLVEGSSIAQSEPTRASFKAIDALQKRYETFVNEDVDLAMVGRLGSPNRYRAEKDDVSDAILEQLKNLELYTRQDVQRRINVVSEAGVSALRMAVGMSLVTVLCALSMSFFVTRGITRPLRKLVNKTREISAGVFKSDLRITSPPEIAELTRAFNSMCEKLTAVDRMKSDFISMISHELRTPLTTIKEGASLVLEGIGGEITQKQERLLTILSAETNRLIGLVNSILDLSKMEAGMMTYSLDEGNIVPLIDQAMTEITPLVEAKKIIFAKEINGDIPPMKMDRDRMLQALRNLLGNAAKFTPEKGRIVVAACSVRGGVEVAVQDTGPGIPAEKLPIIFEKFSGSDHKRGTGLGLAIVKHIIEGHGGKVWAESMQGQGSRFTFFLQS